jgi:hypothetical protein
LVNHDGVFDQCSMYCSTEELWFPEWEHGGTYFDKPKEHESFKPSSLVARWRTLTRVIHAIDFPSPLEQGIATFTALGAEAREPSPGIRRCSTGSRAPEP